MQTTKEYVLDKIAFQEMESKRKISELQEEFNKNLINEMESNISMIEENYFMGLLTLKERLDKRLVCLKAVRRDMFITR